MQDVMDAKNAIIQARDLTGALLVETEYRRMIRLADLRDGIAHPYDVHFFNYAISPQQANYYPCFCLRPEMVERIMGKKEEGGSSYGESTLRELRQDSAM